MAYNSQIRVEMFVSYNNNNSLLIVIKRLVWLTRRVTSLLYFRNDVEYRSIRIVGDSEEGLADGRIVGDSEEGLADGRIVGDTCWWKDSRR